MCRSPTESLSPPSRPLISSSLLIPQPTQQLNPVPTAKTADMCLLQPNFQPHAQPSTSLPPLFSRITRLPFYRGFGKKRRSWTIVQRWLCLFTPQRFRSALAALHTIGWLHFAPPQFSCSLQTTCTHQTLLFCFPSKPLLSPSRQVKPTGGGGCLQCSG